MTAGKGGGGSSISPFQQFFEMSKTEKRKEYKIYQILLKHLFILYVCGAMFQYRDRQFNDYL
jgi:hypothetical protein